MNEQDLIQRRVADVRSRMELACARSGRSSASVLLCAASKTQSAATVALATNLPIDIFGENRVQELTEKYAVGAYGTHPLHFIGHLQTNKVRQVVGAASLIQSVDSEKLLAAIDKEAKRQNIVQGILLEVNIGGEASKSGAAPEELPALCERCEELGSLHIQGLMCIPPRTEDVSAQHRAFEQLRHLAEGLSARHYKAAEMRHLSMGMSADFEAAIEEGATIIRVGTGIFGPRAVLPG